MPFLTENNEIDVFDIDDLTCPKCYSKVDFKNSVSGGDLCGKCDCGIEYSLYPITYKVELGSSKDEKIEEIVIEAEEGKEEEAIAEFIKQREIDLNG